MSTTTTDDAPIGTHTRVPPTESSDDSDDDPGDEQPIGTRTRVR
jgi:hypothetical protein